MNPNLTADAIANWHKRMQTRGWQNEFEWLTTQSMLRQWIGGESINWQDYV